MLRVGAQARGFTLVEVVVAIVLLTIGMLALAASAAATVRSMTDGARIGGIARAAEAARERAYASVCAAAAGSDSSSGARVTWNAAPAGATLTLQQRVTLAPLASSAVTITAAGACR
jgi:prepilin-type N-terminal cleavage/methylation domain-containing protein